MRISEALIAIAIAAAAGGFGAPALALDGTQTPAGPVVPPGAMSAIDAFRDGTLALKHGEKAKALTSLQYAAENGHPLAQWKLGPRVGAVRGRRRFMSKLRTSLRRTVWRGQPCEDV